LHHFGLTATNLKAMVEWYADVLGMVPNHRSSTGGSDFRAAWLSNDQANHCLVIMPDLLVAARASVAELHERAYAGEFSGPSGFYRHCLVTAAARSAAG
jgi:catechol 2,3-dioxygenase-like lactoylglutathione lyase family enzyme